MDKGKCAFPLSGRPPLTVDVEFSQTISDSKRASQRWKNLLNHSESSDITFLIGPNNTPITAHKCILASASDVFHTMFFNKKMNESTTNVVPIGDQRLSPSSFTAFLNFVYAGETTLSITTIFGVLHLAEMYHFPDLVNLCKDSLNVALTAKYSISILKNAELWQAKDIFQKALHLISLYPSRALSQPAFATLSLPLILQIIQLPDLDIPEIQLFEQVLKWYDLNKCQENLQVFQHIRYGCISTVDLARHARCASLMPGDLYLRALELSAGQAVEHSDILSTPRKSPKKTVLKTSEESTDQPKKGMKRKLSVPSTVPSR